MQGDLYSKEDPVVVLDDSCFIGSDWHIKKPCLIGHGILKVYAPWCGHCQGKVECIKRLGKVLREYGVGVYVINYDANPIFQSVFKDRVPGFPTFLEVNQVGVVGKPITNRQGEQVYTIPDILASLCNNKSEVCKLAEQFNGCQ